MKSMSSLFWWVSELDEAEDEDSVAMQEVSQSARWVFHFLSFGMWVDFNHLANLVGWNCMFMTLYILIVMLFLIVLAHDDLIVLWIINIITI